MDGSAMALQAHWSSPNAKEAYINTQGYGFSGDRAAGRAKDAVDEVR
jgi:hypothetical protein